MSNFVVSVGAVLVLGYCGRCVQRIGLPTLVGYLLAGILLGSVEIFQISPDLQMISPYIRQLALVIILLKAGLALDFTRLKTVGRPALLMACLPAGLEILAITWVAPALFPITRMEAGLMGAVLSAVSPAVVVPRMTQFMEERRGNRHKVPEIVLAGASLDDVLVIAVFTSLLSVAEGEGASFSVIPEALLSILFGVGLGGCVGLSLRKIEILNKRLRSEELPEIKILLLIGLSALLLGGDFPFPLSPLLAVMAMAMCLGVWGGSQLAVALGRVWLGGELFLFVLVGAEIQVEYALDAGISAVLLVLIGLFARSLGVLLALLGTELSRSERFFCVISYFPKATVQAAIGGVPLAAGLDCGELILTVAVVAILFTAPLGAFLMDGLGRELLPQEP